jgi:hypothetical protein
MSIYGRDELTDLEKFVLVTALGMGVEHGTNKAAVKYTGMGYRRLFATAAAITLPVYLAGHFLSHRIDSEHGTQRFADTVSDIVTFNVSGIYQRGIDTITNLTIGDFWDAPGRPSHFNDPSDVWIAEGMKNTAAWRNRNTIGGGGGF